MPRAATLLMVSIYARALTFVPISLFVCVVKFSICLNQFKVPSTLNKIVAAPATAAYACVLAFVGNVAVVATATCLLQSALAIIQAL